MEALKKITVADAARKAMEGTATTAEAAKRLYEAAQADPELYRKVMAPFEMSACMDAINMVRRNERAAIWAAPQKESKPNTSPKVMARANSYTLLDFPLPGGLRLADATKADLVEAAKVYRTQANDMARKANWLEAIAGKIGKKRVGNALSVQDLEALQASV